MKQSSNTLIQENIETLMLRHKLRMTKLAKIAGISKGLMWKLMTDDSPNPTVDTLDKIASAFNVPTEELFRK